MNFKELLILRNIFSVKISKSIFCYMFLFIFVIFIYSSYNKLFEKIYAMVCKAFILAYLFYIFLCLHLFNLLLYHVAILILCCLVPLFLYCTRNEGGILSEKDYNENCFGNNITVDYS